MDVQTVEKLVNEMKKGRYVKIVSLKHTIINGNDYVKHSENIYRIVDPTHVKGFQLKGKSNPNAITNQNCKFIKHFTSTNNDLLVVFKTNNPRHKEKILNLSVNGVSIDKETYYANVKSYQSTSPIRTLNIANIISIN